MTDAQLLRRTWAFGLTVLSSVRTRRSYLVPLALADDKPALRGYLDFEDGQ